MEDILLQIKVKQKMKKLLVYITIIVGALFACTIDSAIECLVPKILGLAFLILIIIDLIVISPKDMEELFYDEKIKK